MNFTEFFSDKTTKPKQKTEALSDWLLKNTNKLPVLLEFASSSKDSVRATCIEAVEFSSKQKPTIVNEKAFVFMIKALGHKAPRIKWESAKVIGNSAHLFPDKLNEAIKHLLVNTDHEGTVVRWSAAFALGEILKLKTKHNLKLIPDIQKVIEKEEKNSIKKIYLAALKKIEK